MCPGMNDFWRQIEDICQRPVIDWDADVYLFDPPDNYFVYVHLTKDWDPLYVGITNTKSSFERWGVNGKGYKGQYFELGIKELGWANMLHITLAAGLSKEEAAQMERDLIKRLGTEYPNGYNMSGGGEGVEGFETSDWTRAKQSFSHMGLHQSKASKKKISIGLRGNDNAAKRVMCVETGEIYDSAQAAEDATGISRKSIGKAVNGQQKKAGGFTWKFTESDESESPRDAG